MFKILLLFLLVSCVTTEEVAVPEKVVKSAFPKQEWTDHALKEVIGSNLITASIKDERFFCPNGMNAANWVHLLAAMTRYESNFKPSTEYKESFKDRNGRNVISTGLLQLSLESSQGYKCGFKSQADLKDPLKNITCGVAILSKWVKQDGCISCKSGSSWRGGARYWSVLRNKLDNIKAFMKPYCGAK